jgi:hypothetical protein
VLDAFMEAPVVVVGDYRTTRCRQIAAALRAAADQVAWRREPVQMLLTLATELEAT